MKDIRISRELPQHEGLQTSGLIAPISTIPPDESFAESVGERYSSRVYDLWKRLNLVFLEENTPETSVPAKPPVIVNNFTSQLILQLFGGKHINRLISNDRSNSVLSGAVRGAANNTDNTAARLVKYISEKSAISRELTDFFEIYFTEKAEQTGTRVLNTVLDRVLAECTERVGALSESKEVLERLAQVCHRVYKNTANDISEEILQAAQSQNGAAEVRIKALREKIGAQTTNEAGKAALDYIRSGKPHSEIIRELAASTQKEMLTQSGFAAGSAEQRVLELLERTAFGAESTAISPSGADAAAGGSFTAVLNSVYGGKSKREIIEIMRGVLPENRVITGKSLENDRIVEIAAGVAGFFAGAGEYSAPSAGNFSDIGSVRGAAAGSTVVSPQPISAGLGEVAFNNYQSSLVYTSEQEQAKPNGYVRRGTAQDAQLLSAKMFSGLQSRISRYITDKLVFEQRVSMTSLPTADSLDKEYSAFARLVNHQNDADSSISVLGANTARFNNSTVNLSEFTLNQALKAAAAEGANFAVEQHSANTSVDSRSTVYETSVNAQNITNIATPQSGTVLPAEVRNITNNSADISYIQNTAEATVNAQNITSTATPQSGTVLPAEVRNITNNSADISYIQNTAEATVNAQNVTQSTRVLKGAVLPAELYSVYNKFAHSAQASYIQTDSAPLKGRIIPAYSEKFVVTAQTVHNEPAAQSEKPAKPSSPVDFRRVSRSDAAKNSFRGMLDEKTLAVIDSMLDKANESKHSAPYRSTLGEQTVYEYTRETLDFLSSPIPAEGAMTASAFGMLGHSSPQTMRMVLTHLKAANAVEKGEASTISAQRQINLIKSTDVSISHPEDSRSYLAMNGAVSFRTVDNSENIVMLAPPVEMDRFTAESGYRQLPPIEFREKPQPEPPAQTSKPRVLNEVMKEQSKVKAEAPRGLDGLTREEVSKLADKVYAQIEARIIRERRRMGF